MTDFIKIKVAVINETSLELKMMFGQHDAQISIKNYFKTPSRRIRVGGDGTVETGDSKLNQTIVIAKKLS